MFGTSQINRFVQVRQFTGLCYSTGLIFIHICGLVDRSSKKKKACCMHDSLHREQIAERSSDQG